ncbi:hypothetical protein T492DRAFT_843268 [Pavlovales sp. CCMP2436]|nr:hypothetical protein T492DRAFT_843268 [Pavlovales sp. CCMP2436]
MGQNKDREHRKRRTKTPEEQEAKRQNNKAENEKNERRVRSSFFAPSSSREVDLLASGGGSGEEGARVASSGRDTRLPFFAQSCEVVGGGGGNGDDAVMVTAVPLASVLSPQSTPCSGSERAADCSMPSVRPPPGAPPVPPAQPTPVPSTIGSDLPLKGLTGDGVANTWLLNMLSEETGAGECWRLPAARVNVVCNMKLVLDLINEAYCRDIYIWLPDVQFGHMPPCGECCSADGVTPHCFRSNTSGRRVCALRTHYFVISRRYICGHCKRRAASRKASAQATLAAAQAVATAFGLRPEEEAEEEAAQNAVIGGGGGRVRRSSTGGDDEEVEGSKPYTFMGYNRRSLPLLPYGFGASLPAHLMHRSGLDNELMVSLFDKGIRPEALSSTLIEQHTKRY